MYFFVTEAELLKFYHGVLNLIRYFEHNIRQPCEMLISLPLWPRHHAMPDTKIKRLEISF